MPRPPPAVPPNSRRHQRMRTLQIDRSVSPSPAALYADDQAADPIAKAALVLTHFEHRYPPCRDYFSGHRVLGVPRTQ
jgi:hypothetical protein